MRLASVNRRWHLSLVLCSYCHATSPILWVLALKHKCCKYSLPDKSVLSLSWVLTVGGKQNPLKACVRQFYLSDPSETFFSLFDECKLMVVLPEHKPCWCRRARWKRLIHWNTFHYGQEGLTSKIASVFLMTIQNCGWLFIMSVSFWQLAIWRVRKYKIMVIWACYWSSSVDWNKWVYEDDVLGR